MIAGGLGYLRPVWSNDHWDVYEVIDSPGLLDGAADVVEVDIDSITIDVHERGDIVLRVRESPFWVSEPVRCVESTDDGWIVVRDAPVGRLVVRLDEAEPLSADACAHL